MRKPGAQAKIREFFRANIGRVVTSKEVRSAGGLEVSEWARRLRDVREKDKWPILSHHDSADLKPGEYILKEAPPEKTTVKFEKGISARLRAEVLDRNGFT